jgi:hypothetical protein
LANLEELYDGAPLKLFFLLAENDFSQPPTAEDALAWETTWGFDEDATALLDGAHDGYDALFPGVPGYDASIVLARGSVISAINPTDHITALNNAINQ